MAENAPLSQLTAAMIVRDAEAELPAALRSIEGLAGTIVILDTGSTDRSVDLARAHPSVQLLRATKFTGFGEARQQALDACTTPWVLLIDADERVDPVLTRAIRQAVEDDNPGFDGWRMHRRNFVLGRRMRSMGLDREVLLRLVRPGRVRISPTLVHEVVEPEDSARIGRLGGHLDHHTLRSIDDYLVKIDRYTTLELEEQPRPLRVWHLALVGPGTFVKSFVFRGGWRDGVPGLVWAGLTAISRFMRDMKVWLGQLEPGDGQAEGPPASTDGPLES